MPSPATLRALYGMKRPDSLDRHRSALVLVDFQQEFFQRRLPVPDGSLAANRAADLLRWARQAGLMVVHVRNVATRANSILFAAGSSAIAFVPDLAPTPGEAIITKSMAGAFSRTELDSVLRARAPCLTPRARFPKRIQSRRRGGSPVA